MGSFGSAALIHDEFGVDSGDIPCGLQLLPQPDSGMQRIQSQLLEVAEIFKAVLPDARNTYRADAEV